MTSRLPPSDQHPVIPCEEDMMSRGERVTREVNRSDCLSRQNALVLQCLAAVLNRYAPDIDVYHLTTDELRGIDLPKVKADGRGGAYVAREC